MGVPAVIGRFRFLGDAFTVDVVNRRPNLSTRSTMEQLAGDYATMLATEFDPPVDVVGASTGGSVALQLALDHPELVRRLFVYSSACRLGPAGRRFQQRIADLATPAGGAESPRRPSHSCTSRSVAHCAPRRGPFGGWRQASA